MRTHGIHKMLAVVAVTAINLAHAAYPERPITLVVPFAAGGATDILARTVCALLTAKLKQPCVAENRPGAATAIASAYVSKSKPDGYTLLLTTSSFSVIAAISKNLGYAGVSAFAPVAYLGDTPNVLVVKADSPFRTGAEFIAAGRRKPNTLNYGTSGIGSINHLCAESMKILGNMDMSHIPYKGSVPLLTDLLGGQLSVAFTSLPSSMPFIKEGKVRALAVTSAKRSPMLPDVPTVAEAGIPGYAASAWYGIFAPPSTPNDVIVGLGKALSGIDKDEKARQWASREGLVLQYGNYEMLGQLARSEEARWKEVGQTQRISMD